MPSRVAIIGGGLAGLAAAVALADSNRTVHLFEARRKLGGRAGSHTDPTDGATIDHCQHVAMGCCTAFLEFCQRTGIDHLLERHTRLHFFGPDNQRSDFEPSTWLPAPLHLAPALLGLKYLSLAEKISLARTLPRLMATPAAETSATPTVLAWLQQNHQSPRIIERFWKVVLVSALGESLDKASLVAARKVFYDGFWAKRGASNVLIPKVSLHELYDHHVGSWLRTRGVQIHLETPIESLTGDASSIRSLMFADGTEQPIDAVILAVPWTRVPKLLSIDQLTTIDPSDAIKQIQGAPISSVHLWFDQPITDLPHAVFVERLPQWLFARTTTSTSGEHYYQIVISASYELAGRDRQQIIDEILADLRAIFPLARRANLLRHRLLSEQNAVFSARPGLDALRPTQQTTIPNLFLAGDWTKTLWPATMESAVLSGNLAAAAVTNFL